MIQKKLDRTYTKKELKELSQGNKHVLYENGDGKMAVDGMVFKDMEELSRISKLYANPPWILRIVKNTLIFIESIFVRKKK